MLANRSQSTAMGVVDRLADKAKSDPRSLLSLRSPALAVLGCLALVAGAVLTVSLSPGGDARPVAILSAVMIVVWGGLRWVLLRLTITGALREDPRAVRGAWALGALVWALGVTPELRGVAWAISGIITWVVLERLGATRREAGVSVTVAWGMQALVVLGSWLAQNALVALLATRG